MNVATRRIVYVCAFTLPQLLRGSPEAALAPAVAVAVELPDGRPAANVTVVDLAPGEHAVLNNIAIEGGGARLRTDAAGRCVLPVRKTDTLVAVAAVAGVGVALRSDLARHPLIALQRWGRIEGTTVNRNRALSNIPIQYSFDWRCLGSLELREALSTVPTKTDAQGRFVFEHVPPLEICFAEDWHESGGGSLWHRLLPFAEAKSGETTKVSFATNGRTIVGRLTLDGQKGNFDLQSCFGAAVLDVDWTQLAPPWPPADIDTVSKRTAWWQHRMATDDIVRREQEASAAGASLEFRADGSFVGHMVEPGRYWTSGCLRQGGKTIAQMETVHFVIPPSASETDDTPFDIGPVALRPQVSLHPGDTAPDFDIKTVDGNALRLTDFRGKVVLIDFWATWCGPCVAEIPSLQRIYWGYAKDERFALISLSLDRDPEAPAAFALSKGLPWVQGFLGDWTNDKLTTRYGVYGIPAVFLIGRDGKVISTGLRGHALEVAVETALAE